MAELDKKIQKPQTDLVQAVLEAQEKKNLERVDMLINNAIKQLKMSRFKPDQSTCISLTYLAKIRPDIFSQSNAIKEVLKSLLRTANLKAKNDIILPVLAANILLACCDSAEVRTIILTKIDHWLSSNQKPTDLIQHLLATLCVKCKNDKTTIVTLIEMRQHWLQYLEDNFDSYSPVPSDLCSSVRKLLQTETSCEHLIMYIRFLIKQDKHIVSLGKELSKFVNDRPITLSVMYQEKEFGEQLVKMILKVFLKLINHLQEKKSSSSISGDESKKTTKPEDNLMAKDVPMVQVKEEPGLKVKEETTLKPKEEGTVETKEEPIVKADGGPDVKGKELKDITEPTENNQESSSFSSSTPVPPLYVKLSNSSIVITLDRFIIEAILSLLATIEVSEECCVEFNNLLNYWVNIDTPFYNDFALTSPYNLPNKLRKKLVHSKHDQLIDIGLRSANPGQLVQLLHQFGTSTTTINKILKHLESVHDLDLIRCEIRDISFFNQLMEFYSQSMGLVNAGELQKRLELTV